MGEREAIKQFSLSAAAKKSNSPISRFIGEEEEREREREREGERAVSSPTNSYQEEEEWRQGSRSRHSAGAIPAERGNNP